MPNHSPHTGEINGKTLTQADADRLVFSACHRAHSMVAFALDVAQAMDPERYAAIREQLYQGFCRVDAATDLATAMHRPDLAAKQEREQEAHHV